MQDQRIVKIISYRKVDAESLTSLTSDSHPKLDRLQDDQFTQCQSRDATAEIIRHQIALLLGGRVILERLTSAKTATRLTPGFIELNEISNRRMLTEPAAICPSAGGVKKS